MLTKLGEREIIICEVVICDALPLVFKTLENILLEEYEQFDDYIEMVVQFGVSKSSVLVKISQSAVSSAEFFGFFLRFFMLQITHAQIIRQI